MKAILSWTGAARSPDYEMKEETPAELTATERFFQASEWRQIVTVLILATLTLFGIAALFQRDPKLSATLLSSIGMHVAGARAPAILICLNSGMSPAASLFFNFYIEILIVILVYYSFVFLVREGIESKLLRIAAKQAEEAAQRHKNLLKRFELFGLFLLVMAPLPMTGPVSGALVGYLLNIKPWVTFSIVLSGTFVALAGYVAIGQVVLSRVIAMQAQYQGVGTIVIAVVIAAFTIYHVRTIAGWVEDSVSDAKKD